MEMAPSTACQNRQASVPPLYSKGELRGSLKLQSYEPHALLNSILPFFLMPDEDLTAKRLEARVSFLSWFVPLVRRQQRAIRPTSLRWIMRRMDRFFFYGLLTEGDDPLVRLEYKDDVFESRSLEVLFTPQGDAWVPLGRMHPHLQGWSGVMDDATAPAAMNDRFVRGTKRDDNGETLEHSSDTGMLSRFTASRIRGTELQYQANWGDYDSTRTAELAETTSQWRGTIKVDATDPYRNYEERKLEDVVAVLVHEMAHAFLSAFVCGCDSCNAVNYSTDSFLGQTSHGIVFRRLIAAMETVMRSWSPSLSSFTIPNHERKRDMTDAELKRSRAAWEFELKLKAQRRS